MSGIADGGIGGGNILGHIAEGIMGGGGASGSTARSGPGGTSSIWGPLTQEDFANAGSYDYSDPPPGYDYTSQDFANAHSDFANALNTPLPGDTDMILTDDYPRPDINPRPTQRPRPGTAADSFDWTPVNNNENINYGVPIGPQMNPNAVTPSSGGCSCSRKKYSCEDKCAYNAQMKMQCKGCKSYFRKTKNYVYPKRRRYARSYSRPRYTRRKRTTRRKI